jgi:hypothetical protein
MLAVLCCDYWPFYRSVHSFTADPSRSVLLLWALYRLVHGGRAETSSAVLLLWAIIPFGT